MSRNEAGGGSSGQGPAEFAPSPQAQSSRDLLARERAVRAETEAAIARLLAVEQVTEPALSNLPLESLLRELLGRIRRLLQGDAARLLLVTEDGRGLHVRAFDGLSPQAPEDAFIPIRWGVPGRIAAERRPLIVDDLSQVEVVSPPLRTRLRSLIGAPLMVDGEAIGVIDVATVEPRHFDRDELRLLELVADRAALAIENARLFEQVRFERARWQATVESMLDPVAVADAQGNITYMNAALQRYAAGPGLPVPERAAYCGICRHDGRPFAPGELPLQRAAGRGEEVHGVEALQRTVDGQEELLVWNAAPLRVEGEVTGAVAVGRGVTQERRTEAERERLLAEVQRRAAELDATLTSVADGLIIYSPDGSITRMNRAAQDILGYSPEERQRPVEERLRKLRLESSDGRPFPEEETPPRRAIRGEEVRGVVTVLHPPTGRTVWVSASAAPIHAPDGSLLGAVMTFTDITHLHELQEQREDFLRAVSHDLRNPLAVVQGQAQLLLRALDRAGLTGDERRGTEAILTSAQRMNSMIQDLVDSARLEAGQLPLRPQSVDLPALILELQHRLAGTLEMQRVQVQAAEGLPTVWADPDRVERILTNLLSNALKYSHPGSPVLVNVSRSGDMVITTVSDRGPGIAPEQLPHLFERYYRAPGAERGREGLGLGLYITRLLVEAHGGQVWAESQVGVGSTFGFSLPVAG